MKDICILEIAALSILYVLNFSSGSIYSNDPHSYYKDFFSYFINEAPKYEAIYDVDYFEKTIPWLDTDLLDQSARFYTKNYMGVSIIQMNSLIEALAMKSIASVVLTTQSFEDIPKAYDRILKTFLYIRILCESGSEILDRKSDAGKTIKLIRQRHRSAAYISENRSLAAIDVLHQSSKLVDEPLKENFVPDDEIQSLALAIRTDLEIVDTSEAPPYLKEWDWSKAVGQFDLGVAQFLFCGQAVMKARDFGIYFATEEDVQAHVHFWAVVGRLIGIEDRFNVALNLPFDMYNRFYRNVVVASFKNTEEIAVRRMSNMMEGLKNSFLIPTVFSFKCWLYYTLKNTLVEFEGSNIFKLFNLEDRVCLQFMRIVSGPINLSLTVSNFTRNQFDNWMQQEFERLGITREF